MLVGRELEARANALGIPWTYLTSNEELRALIHAQERQTMVELRDGKYYFDGTEQPACFGLFWEGIPGSAGDQCRSCVFTKVCLATFVQTTLPKAEGSSGPASPAVEVGKKLDGLSAEAIEVAREYRDRVYPSTTQDTTTQEEEPIVATKKKKAPKKATKKASKKKAPKKKAPAKKASKKVARQGKKKAPKKKAASKKKAATRSPKKAPSAKRVKAAAPSRKKPASTAKAQGVSGTDPWGEHTYLSRWTKERERSPLIAQVTPGTTLKKEWPAKSGEVHTAKCYKGYWKVTPYGREPLKVPTLYKCVEEVTLEGSKWSGPKFWKLKQLFDSAK